MYIGDYAGIPAELRTAWIAASHRRHTSFDQLPGTTASFDAASPGTVTVVATAGSVASFRRENGLLISIMGRDPYLLLTPRVREQVDADALGVVTQALPNSIVYFPLLSGASSARLEAHGALTWRRRPTPLIDWSQRGADLLDRVAIRLGKRASRRWHRFQQAGLVFQCLAGDAAACALERVESQSWKHSAGFGLLHTPPLLRFYLEALRRELISMHAVLDNDRPIAYRLDAASRCMVTCLKWSFDDRYKAQSPGFNLLTKGIVTRWSEVDLDYIDLAGSPDPLKLLLCTSLAARWDAAWPDSDRARQQMADRQRHDADLARAFAAGHGYRRIYAPGEQW